MSSPSEGTKISNPQPDDTLESEPPEKDKPGVTTEETGNEKLDEEVAQTDSDAKNCDVRGEAEIKEDNGVEHSRDISIGEVTSEPERYVEKAGGLQAEPIEGSSGKETKDVTCSDEHRDKVPYHVLLVPDSSSSTEGMPSRIKLVPIVIQQDPPEGSKKCDYLKTFDPKEIGETVLDPWSKEQTEDSDQTGAFMSSGHHFPRRSVPDPSCSKPEIIRFDSYRPPSESSSESEDDTVSDSGQDSVEDTQTPSIGDSQPVRSKLAESLSNFISQEQESILFGSNENVHVLNVSGSGFTAERVEPCIIALVDRFRISFDVSRFSKESISCRVVGNKVDVYAREERQNDYGCEMHEIHQIFKIPRHVDKDKFKAFVTNGLLFIQAPIEISR